jgi:hypothetical protein
MRDNVKMTGPPTLAAKPPPAVAGPCRLTCYLACQPHATPFTATTTNPVHSRFVARISPSPMWLPMNEAASAAGSAAPSFRCTSTIVSVGPTYSERSEPISARRGPSTSATFVHLFPAVPSAGKCSRMNWWTRREFMRDNVKMTGPPPFAAEPPPAGVGPCRLTCYGVGGLWPLYTCL